MLLPEISTVVSEFTTPIMRLGVTGLSRSGKTVFITALVRALTEGAAKPTVAHIERVPGMTARLDPQPDHDVPRFPYENALAALAGDPPRWPESTRSVSQLRLTIEWDGVSVTSRMLGGRQRLHVDILDYPGEWLGDLALLEMTFEQWSSREIATARSPLRVKSAAPFLSFLGEAPWKGRTPEQIAIAGAERYTRYLEALRALDPGSSSPGPGRFLLPGDFEGTPLLTYFPSDGVKAESPLGSLLSERFESYKAKVVRPFFERHFSRLDRQIVLVDVLGALNGGAEALNDLERTLEEVMRAFRPGRTSWLWRLAGRRRIDRILFAATKADLLHRSSHRLLARVLEKAVSRASERVEKAGARHAFIAISALRATEDVETKRDGIVYHCLQGIPEPGEIVLGRKFDGRRAAVVYPGRIPDDPLEAFDAASAPVGAYRFVRFCPPHIGTRETLGSPTPWPHLGLDEAMSYLIGDMLP